MMGGANPDGVDAEVGNYWRTLYKLEKNFDSIPAAKKIASKVSKEYHIYSYYFLIVFEVIHLQYFYECILDLTFNTAHLYFKLTHPVTF